MKTVRLKARLVFILAALIIASGSEILCWWYTPNENLIIGSWELSQRSQSEAADVDVILTYNKDHSVTMRFVRGHDQVREVSYPIEWNLYGRSLTLTSRFEVSDLPVQKQVQARTQVFVAKLNASTMVWYGRWFRHGAVLKRLDSMAAMPGHVNHAGSLVGFAGADQRMVASSFPKAQ